ncbi:MAG: ABC transporter ATP-binding protein [Planctomycetota bacterium]
MPSSVAAPEQAHAFDVSGDGAVAQVLDVRKVYKMGSEEVHALAGVSLSIGRGEFVSLMGQSGSGKSTLLNLLGTLDRPTSGRYVLGGRDVGRMNDGDLSDFRLRTLGFIFQSFNLIPQLTVRENIELPLTYLGTEPSESADRAADLAEKVGLGGRLGHRPTELSGGQQQRVAIARSLANDPPLMLADEPTGNLDTATTKQIMTLLLELNEQGKTIVMVTHEPEIAEWTSRQIHMRDGKVVSDEGSESLKEEA